MKNTIYFLAIAALFFGFTACEDDEPILNIDPIAADITFEVAGFDRLAQDFVGTVEVTGYFMNIGTSDFRGGANAQRLVLEEAYPGGEWDQVAVRWFTDFNTEDTITISYNRVWDLSSPAEGEFAPDYRIRVVYEDFVLQNDTETNKDINLANNELVESGWQVPEMIP